MSEAVIDAFGKNGQVKKVFWTVFTADGRAGDGPGCGSGDSSAGGGDYYGDGGVSDIRNGSYPVAGCADLRFMPAHSGTRIPGDPPFPSTG